MLKTISIVAALLLSAMSAAAQSTPDSMKTWLIELDNQSVIIARKPSLHVELDSQAQKILDHSSAEWTGLLFAYLDSSNRVLAAHVLLTKSLGEQNQRLHYTTEDMTEKIVVDYSFNGFHWQEFFDKTNLSTELKMDRAEMSRIKAYWKDKLNTVERKPGT